MSAATQQQQNQQPHVHFTFFFSPITPLQPTANNSGPPSPDRINATLHFSNAPPEVFASFLNAFNPAIFANGPAQPHFQGQPPASKSAIKTELKPVVIDSETKTCPVCCDTFSTSVSVDSPQSTVELTCGHPHHRSCLESWLANSNTCPVCRYEIETDNAEYNVGVKKRMQERMRKDERVEEERAEQRCYNKRLKLCTEDESESVESDGATRRQYEFDCQHVFCENCFKTSIAVMESGSASDDSEIFESSHRCPACRKMGKVRSSLVNVPGSELQENSTDPAA
ncbi:hypothetical protein HK098_004387 [Nowakowskiella sp. JEL0407]|nr:hypothetical protein HK098_004387 [Nowakowskiella sp. JEL0407]